ncbi:head decoration protein (plasmid) [Azospirillum humicireducens]|uniref:Head decoration protein n=1 Tax=Azospirillum humicireducens TaxID=1226968 RepID=A0A2R4VSS0_9PROT|nr:head decoration protein [Azospirillum humicireducens]AWB07498.1 head decoration protein [Azospirillum humicireducens]
MTPASFSSQTSQPLPSLIGGDFPRVTRLVTIAGGSGVLAAGAVLGRIAASKRYALSVAMASDGSEAPRAILAEPVDATAADVEAIVYVAGEFNPDQLTFGAGHSAASAADALRDLSIFL